MFLALLEAETTWLTPPASTRFHLAEEQGLLKHSVGVAELALNECWTGNLHTFNDATKLTGPTNEIRYGYLLFFVRDDFDYKRNEKNIWENLEDAAKRVRVVFAQVEGQAKPKPVFLGVWGVV